MLTNSNKIKDVRIYISMSLVRLKCNSTGNTRVAITYVVILMVLFTASFMPVNPTAAVLTPPLLGETISNRVDISSYHSSLPISEMSIPTSTSTSMMYNPSSLSSSTTPTTQAALHNVLSFQSNDIVNSKAIYEILFRTATTVPIKTIEMVFPAGTGISGAGYIERIGIGGPESWIKSGNKITYTVASPVSLPAGTPIRFEIVNVKNPSIPSSNYHVTVTTRDAANAIIDGPTQSNAYNIRQIGASDIDPEFMQSRLLRDDATGASFGWNPGGMVTDFIIIDEAAVIGANAILINVGDSSSNSQCEALGSLSGFFTIQCSTPPPDGSELRYTTINLPLS